MTVKRLYYDARICNVLLVEIAKLHKNQLGISFASGHEKVAKSDHTLTFQSLPSVYL